MPDNLRSRPWFRMTPLFQIISVIYCIAALSYILYSGTESGPGAYLMKLEMDIIGRGDEVITSLLAFGVLLAPLWAITKLAGKIAPRLLWASADTPKHGLAERLSWPVQSVSWTAILVMTAIPIIVGAALYPATYYPKQRDLQETVYPVDLAAGVVDLPNGARFADVTGVLAQSHRLTFKHTFNSLTVSYELFAPITSMGWTAADPVRYFVHIKQYGDSSRQSAMARRFSAERHGTVFRRDQPILAPAG